jgi:hypothetical protein
VVGRIRFHDGAAAVSSNVSKKPWETVSNNGVWTMYDAVADITTINVPCVDENGRHYVRQIIVRGDNVLDHGRDQA